MAMLRYRDYIYVAAETLPKRGLFYGYHHNDVWDFSDNMLDKQGDWRISVGLSKNTLYVDHATEDHYFFREALRDVVQHYPEVLDMDIIFDGPRKTVREVLELTEQATIENTTFYHGTSSAFYDKIMQEGLRPRSETNVCPTYGARYNAPEGRCDFIYLTTQHNTAAYAAREASSLHGGDPIILQVGPGLREYYAEVDEDSLEYSPIMSLWTLGSIAYRRTIEPRLLKLYARMDQGTWEKVALVRTAITPEQKEKKKDYLLQQEMESAEEIPDFEEVWKGIIREDDSVYEWASMIAEDHYMPDDDDIREAAIDLLETQGVEDPTEEQILEVWDGVEGELREAAVQEALNEHLKPEYEQLYSDALDRIEVGLDGEDCWRELTAAESVDPTELTGLGIYWAYEESAAQAHWGGGKNPQVFRFRARIDETYINKAATVWANTQPSTGEEEKEVQFYQHAPIYVYDVEVYSGGYPRRYIETIEIEDWRRC